MAEAQRHPDGPLLARLFVLSMEPARLQRNEARRSNESFNNGDLLAECCSPVYEHEMRAHVGSVFCSVCDDDDLVDGVNDDTLRQVAN